MNDSTELARHGVDHFLQVAIEQQAPVETMERLLRLKQEYERDEARKLFHAALSRFKAAAPKIVNDALVEYRSKRGYIIRYKHARLGAICAAVTPALASEGLAVRWESSQDTGVVSVTCILEHEAGHSVRTSLRAPHDQSGDKNPIQMLGSTVTYLQRYTLLALLGIASVDDDDARCAMRSETRNEAQDKTDSKTDGRKTITGTVDEVTEPRVGADGTRWWAIRIAGIYHVTNDEEMCAIAAHCESENKPVRIEYVMNRGKRVIVDCTELLDDDARCEDEADD